MAGTRQAKRPASKRQLRVGEEMRHALADLLTRETFRDPDLAGVSVTVTEVSMSPDLKNASAFVTPLGGENAAAVVAALNRCSTYIRTLLARAVPLRNTPRITFKSDDSFEQASRIDSLLRQVAAEQGSDDIDRD
ncbi:30S ribosome-binding factor RbfA [Oceanibacterium hippocampi]|uniref:Ribosome-binding factor A n=1 Tax=Oceanibacterium hippocampi TaxID=745714 RepID=A0A1Y5RK35_9PROT|nr:30S ribosome-binding factor RbfA [Oceanibacterium hippocampi]SLN19120.1 Ribosome-binding factor A [Oceanibacterium hippocampi]